MPFVSFLAQATAPAPEPGLLQYFLQSNFAGQLIIYALALFSLVAWTIMLGKFMELRRLQLFNLGFQMKLREQRTILDLPDGFQVPVGVPYAALFRDAIDESAMLASVYRDLADELDCGFFDAGSVAHTTPVDGVHLDAENTRAIGRGLVIGTVGVYAAMDATASTRRTSGTARRIACSMPARSVIMLIGQVPQAPRSSSSTTMSSVTDCRRTLPPSAIRYGRIASSVSSMRRRSWGSSFTAERAAGR